MLTNRQRSASPLEALLDIAQDLTASLAAADRYARLLAAVRSLIPCDAACLLRLEGDDLVPVAGYGLTTAALSRRYARRDHPRLDIILSSKEPVRFPVDSRLPDPFDGAIDAAPGPLQKVHACLGCALSDSGEVVGALTADALEATQLRSLWTIDVLATLGALAGRGDADHGADRGAGAARGIIAAAWRASWSAAPRNARRRNAGRQPSPWRSCGARSRWSRRPTWRCSSPARPGSGRSWLRITCTRRSARADEAMIHVNCAALPLSIAESELFGHVAGAFTGAVRDRAGKFEVADGGTLLLDEIGELSLEIQPKLLRVLQHGEIQRVGADRAHRVNVRVIAATNRDLAREVSAGRFRADLFHRLAAFPLHVPPLRERRTDILGARRALRRRGGAPPRAGGRAPDGSGAPGPRERRLAGQRARARERHQPRRAPRLLRRCPHGRSPSSTRRTSTFPAGPRAPRSGGGSAGGCRRAGRSPSSSPASSARPSSPRLRVTAATGPPPRASSACTAATCTTAPSGWGSN